MNPTIVDYGDDGHKSLFDGSPSECDDGVVTIRYGLIFT